MPKTILSHRDHASVARILNLPLPTSDDEPVRLRDLNAAVEGLAWKDSARVAAPANINLSAPGANIDGIALNAGDRVLAIAQTNASENGIYIWNGAGVGMTRALDASTAAELESATLMIEEGTSAGVSYRQTSVNFTLGTNPINWVQFGTNAPQSSTTTSGLIRTATQAEVDAGAPGNIAITPETLKNYAERLRKYAIAIGDGSATTFAVSHNFNTRRVKVEVYRNSGNYDTIDVDVERPTLNTVQITFAVAPPSSGYEVVVIG